MNLVGGCFFPLSLTLLGKLIVGDDIPNYSTLSGDSKLNATTPIWTWTNDGDGNIITY